MHATLKIAEISFLDIFFKKESSPIWWLKKISGSSGIPCRRFGTGISERTSAKKSAHELFSLIPRDFLLLALENAALFASSFTRVNDLYSRYSFVQSVHSFERCDFAWTTSSLPQRDEILKITHWRVTPASRSEKSRTAYFIRETSCEHP